MQRTDVFFISASIDDGDDESGSSTPDLTGLDIEIGNGVVLDIFGYLRFPLTTVYKNATIDAATLTVKAYTACADSWDPIIHIEDTNNSVAFGTTEDLSARSWYGTPVTWSSGAWTQNTYYTSPSLVTQIDYVTGLNGWLPGNYVTLKIDSTNILKDEDERKWYSWDYDNANATTYRAYLIIQHTHACNPPNSGTWIIDSASGTCVLARDTNYDGDLSIEDGETLDIEGFNLGKLNNIYISGSNLYGFSIISKVGGSIVLD